MIKFNIENRMGHIEFARPESGNAFTNEMALQFGDVMRRMGDEADIVTLSGEGADFTIGRDRHEPRKGTPFEAFHNVSAVNQAMAAFPGIIVAAVRGRAHGLGVGLIMRSDIAIAACDSRFGLDEVAHDIPPMFIMEEIVDHLPPKRALDIILSGREFGAEEALVIGLLSRVVPPVELDTVVGGFVEDLRASDKVVVAACKNYLRKVRRMQPEARSAYALVKQTEFALRKC